MKTLWILLILFVAQNTFAGSELACWNTFGKKGALPVITAEINAKDELVKVQLNNKDTFFTGFVINEEVKSDDKVGHKTGVVLSDLGTLKGSEITSTRSPYKGNVEYPLDFGSYTFEAPWGGSNSIKYSGRWILPANLSPEALNSFRFPNRPPSERSNSVITMLAPPSSDQGGNITIRLFCVSK